MPPAAALAILDPATALGCVASHFPIIEANML